MLTPWMPHTGQLGIPTNFVGVHLANLVVIEGAGTRDFNWARKLLQIMIGECPRLDSAPVLPEDRK